MILNKIQAVFGGTKIIKTAPIEWQYDQKQYLKVIGLVIPDYNVMDFCNAGDATTKSYAVVDNQVLIPDEYLRTGKDVEAYLVITGDDNSVQTRYKITIPVNKRPARTDITPTPAEQSQIDLLVVALNDGVTRSEAAALAAEGSAGRAATSENNADTSARNAAGSEANASASELAASSSESNALSYMGRAETAATNAERDSGTATSAKDAAVIAQGKAETAQEAAEAAARQAQQAFTYADDGNGNITIAYAGGE